MVSFKLRSVATAFFLVSVSLVALAPGVSAAQQTWFLTESTTVTNDALATNAESFMYKSSTNGATDITLSNAGNVIHDFASDEHADVGVTYGADSWTANIAFTHNVVTFPRLITVTLLHGTDAATATQVATGTFTLNVNPSPVAVTLPTTGFTVATGSSLILRIDASNLELGESLTIDVTGGTASPSTLVSPTSDPGFPTPSLGSLVLLASGLAIIGGAAYINRRSE